MAALGLAPRIAPMRTSSSVVVRVDGNANPRGSSTSRAEWRFACRLYVETRIGKRLAAIREHRRISQADLDAALGPAKLQSGIMSTAKSD